MRRSFRSERASGSGTYEIAITAAGAAHTKGSYTEILAATGFDADWLLIERTRISAANALVLMDLAIGAAASEQIIASNIMGQSGVSGVAGGLLALPVSLPKGTRLSARVQAGVASQQYLLAIRLIKNVHRFRAPLTIYGVDTATTRGTSVDPGAVADTKGAWSQIVAATSRPIIGLIVLIGQQGHALTFGHQRVDIGVGAAASEQVVIPDLGVLMDQVDSNIKPWAHWFPVSIPSGTRIAARCQTNVTTSPDRLIDVSLIGIG